MTVFDDLHEQRRLQALYASMADEELLQLSADADSLTDTAFEALEDEMERRRLPFAPPREKPQEFESRKLVTVAQYRELPAALVAKSAIESAGIECFLTDINMVRITWSPLVGGIQLQVGADDAGTAWRILNRVPDASDAEEPAT